MKGVSCVYQMFFCTFALFLKIVSKMSIAKFGWFGTSMSARRILGLEKVPRVGLFAH